MTRFISAMMILSAVGCNKAETDSGAATDTQPPTTPVTTPTTQGSCTPQDWPIDDEDHQLDRVWEYFDDNAVMYWMPDEPRGAFIMLHASKRDVTDLDTLEYEEFYNELAARDIGYFGVSSVSAGGSWASSKNADNNVDTQEIAAFRDYLIDITDLSEDTPLFVMGFSGGAGFTSNMAQQGLDMGWDMRGFKAHNGVPYVEAPLPAIMVYHINDSPGSGEAQCERQADLGYRTECHTYDELPLTAERFTTIPGIDSDEAQIWFDEAVDAGLVDANGVRLTPISDADQAFEDFEDNSAVPGANRATVQLKVLWRVHIVSEDRACEEANFFDKELL